MLSSIMGFLRKIPLSTYYVLAVIILIATLHHQVAHMRMENQELALKLTNEQAANSVTVNVSNGLEQIAHRLAEQVKLKQDSLDKALKIKPVIKYVAVAQIDSAVDTVYAPVEGDTADRKVTMQFDRAPLHAQISMTVPPPPAQADGVLVAHFDPIGIKVRMGCSEGAAKVVFETPEWMMMHLDSLAQDPDVCAHTHSSSAHSVVKPAVIGGVVGAILGAIGIVKLRKK